MDQIPDSAGPVSVWMDVWHSACRGRRQSNRETVLRRGEGQSGSRNGYEAGQVRTAEGAFEVAVPQVRGGEQPFRSSLRRGWQP
ncbi:MAG: hypothetical protein M3186_09025 [Actinomycetota bacterium]|nr:hypothetical protein [Actinomycetota bacterium]